MDPTTIDPTSLNITSTGGIVLTSFFLTEVAKNYITPKIKYLSKIPVILFPIVFCACLTVLANKVMRLNNGSPLLVGNIWTLLGSSFTAAAGSSGLYTWLTKGNVNVGEAKSIADKTPESEDHMMRPNP